MVCGGSLTPSGARLSFVGSWSYIDGRVLRFWMAAELRWCVLFSGCGNRSCATECVCELCWLAARHSLSLLHSCGLHSLESWRWRKYSGRKYCSYSGWCWWWKTTLCVIFLRRGIIVELLSSIAACTMWSSGENASSVWAGSGDTHVVYFLEALPWSPWPLWRGGLATIVHVAWWSASMDVGAVALDSGCALRHDLRWWCNIVSTG